MQQSFRSLPRLPLLASTICPNIVAPYLRLPFKSRPPFVFTTKIQISTRHLRSIMSQVHLVTDDLEKPVLDDRSYRVITLPNKLEALLVHDPETDKASASLNVNVGSFSDEEGFEGVCHAVEHMLFMGTEKVCLVFYVPRDPAPFEVPLYNLYPGPYHKYPILRTRYHG